MDEQDGLHLGSLIVRLATGMNAADNRAQEAEARVFELESENAALRAELDAVNATRATLSEQVEHHRIYGLDAEAEIAKLRAELAAARDAQQWRPLPPPRGKGSYLFFHDGRIVTADWPSVVVDDATHWMPLPPPPAAAEAQ